LYAEPFCSKQQRPIEVFLTETLHPADPGGMNEKFMAAKKREIEGLISKYTWKVVDRSKVKTDANILNGRFVHKRDSR
jgi:hypothetical protein